MNKPHRDDTIVDQVTLLAHIGYPMKSPVIFTQTLVRALAHQDLSDISWEDLMAGQSYSVTL
jgi:hypothetical protein